MNAQSNISNGMAEAVRKAKQYLLIEETVNHQQRKIMNKLEIKGDWNIAKGKLKQKFAKLTDNDLRFVEGQEEELVGRLQKLTGRTRAEIEHIIHESL